MKRRVFLASATSALVSGLAGCNSFASDRETRAPFSVEPTATETTTRRGNVTRSVHVPLTFENFTARDEVVSLKAVTGDTSIAWRTETVGQYETFTSPAIRSTGEYTATVAVRDGPFHALPVTVTPETHSVQFELRPDDSVRARELLRCSPRCRVSDGEVTRRQQAEGGPTPQRSRAIVRNDASGPKWVSFTVEDGEGTVFDADFDLNSSQGVVLSELLSRPGNYEVRVQTSENAARDEWDVSEQGGTIRASIDDQHRIHIECVPLASSFFTDVTNRDDAARTVEVTLSNDRGVSNTGAVTVPPGENETLQVALPPGGVYETDVRVGDDHETTTQSLCQRVTEFAIVVDDGRPTLVPVDEYGRPVED
ncbi:hypothetical protein [Haloarchaeobius sp. DFWS5]|uniref:hypothetical protein n=1 Tax=Haloarchaeobius sp. DFWS5 TaxID=3446114 RepID=UPI003EB7EB50